MRALLLSIALAGCGSEDLGTQKQPVAEDYPLSLQEAEAAIEAHSGEGCLRMASFVPCRGCAPQYRLDAIADGASVGPCGRSTFVAGRVVTVENDETYTWTCASGPLGGAWNSAAKTAIGALVCRD